MAHLHLKMASLASPTIVAVVVIVAVPVVVVIIVVFVAFIIANSLSARGECFSTKPRPGEPTSITGACVVVEFLFPLSIHNVIMYTQQQQQRQKLQSQQRVKGTGPMLLLLAVVVVRGRCSTDTEQRKKNCPIRHQSRQRRDRGRLGWLLRWMHPGGKEFNHCLWREVCIILERTIFQQIHRWKKWTLKGLKCDTLAAGSSAVSEGRRIGDCKAYERRTS